MRVLVVAGSVRQASYNRQLARTAAAFAVEAGASATLLELGEYAVPLYDADLEARGTPPDVLRLKQAFFEHPAWIVCTPEYNASYPALLKNVFDWVSSPVVGDSAWADGLRATRGKVAGILSTSPGALGGLRAHAHLAPLLLNLQCWVCPCSHAVGHAGSTFDAEGRLADEGARRGVRAVVDQVLWAAGRLAK